MKSVKLIFFQGKALELVNISIKSFKDIILHDSKKYFVKKFSNIIQKVCNIRVVSFVIADAPRNIIVPAILVILIIFTFNYSKNYDLTTLLPEIAALIFAIQRIIPIINAIFNSVIAIASAYQTNEDVFIFIKRNEIYNLEGKELENKINLEKKFNFLKSIEIKNLSFAYEKNKNILSSLNLKINKAEKIAITGSNGSGKSTFVNILMGFYEDYRGSILLTIIS